MSQAAKKTADRIPPAATDATSRRRHVRSESSERETLSGIPVEPFYRPNSLGADWSYEARLGDPGQFPYTRGPH